MNRPHDNSYCGWTEYDIKEMGWQIYTFSGETYVKKDFRGNFFNTRTGEVVPINKLFRFIRNVTNSEGYILAKRKKLGAHCGK